MQHFGEQTLVSVWKDRPGLAKPTLCLIQSIVSIIHRIF